jgi:ribulose-5-phosphate 4-epimerase/fuculose-1-phosphate aldolase
MLRNHGLLTVGRSIAEAWTRMYFFEAACRIQIDAQSGGEVITVDPRILEGVGAAMNKASTGVGPEQLVWPALMRRLDRTDPSYKT